MIGLSGQSWAVLVIVAAAVVYLGYLAWRTLRRGRSVTGCCATGCPPAGQDAPDARGSEATRFVPLDNLAELARRHKESRTGPEQPS